VLNVQIAGSVQLLDVQRLRKNFRMFTGRKFLRAETILIVLRGDDTVAPSSPNWRDAVKRRCQAKARSKATLL
jgi:hypothetical protein